MSDKKKSTNTIDSRWGGLGITKFYLAVPELLLLHRKRLGLTWQDLNFILMVHLCRQRWTIPYAVYLGIDRKTVTACKKRLIALGYMIDNTTEFGRDMEDPEKSVKPVPSFDFTGLYRAVAALAEAPTAQTMPGDGSDDSDAPESPGELSDAEVPAQFGPEASTETSTEKTEVTTAPVPKKGGEKIERLIRAQLVKSLIEVNDAEDRRAAGPSLSWVGGLQTCISPQHLRSIVQTAPRHVKTGELVPGGEPSLYYEFLLVNWDFATWVQGLDTDQVKAMSTAVKIHRGNVKRALRGFARGEAEGIEESAEYDGEAEGETR